MIIIQGEAAATERNSAGQSAPSVKTVPLPPGMRALTADRTGAAGHPGHPASQKKTATLGVEALIETIQEVREQ